MVSKARLRELFDYYDGFLIRLSTSTIAGSDSGDGYWRVVVDGIKMPVSHVVLLMHGIEIPEDKEVDHRNRIRSDNHLENLRVVSKSLNQQNKNSKNVYFHNGKQRFVARARLNGKEHSRYFMTEQEAMAGVIELKKALGIAL